MKLLIATRNAKKGREMAALIAPAWEPSGLLGGLEVVTLDGYPDLPEVVEDADTLRRQCAQEGERDGPRDGAVDGGGRLGPGGRCAGGAPGVLSARYAGAAWGRRGE